MSSPEIWRKSTFSAGTDGGNCVEVAHTPEAVTIRDSKNPDSPLLTVPHARWHHLMR